MTHVNILMWTLLLLPFASAAAKDELFLRAPDCGVVYSHRIAKGEQAGIDEFPWSALVITDFVDRLDSSRCGGALINNRWVLTAAHCVDYPNVAGVWVRLGEWNLDTDVDFVVDNRGIKETVPPPIELDVSYFIHSNYNASRYQANDIALLKLSKTVNFTDFVKPICLPLDQEQRDDRLVDADVYISGWGLVDETKLIALPIKRKATVTVVDWHDCRSKYAAEGKEVNDEQLCALGENLQDTCKGDSGGPLMMTAYDERHRNFFYLAGVTSYGKKPCESNAAIPGVYTRVGAYINWIMQTMGDNS